MVNASVYSVFILCFYEEKVKDVKIIFPEIYSQNNQARYGVSTYLNVPLETNIILVKVSMVKSCS